MKDLSVTEEYVLCALNKKGVISSYGIELEACIAAGGLIDLIQSYCIKLNEKKEIVVIKDLDAELDFLKPMYDWLKSSKSKNVSEIANDYMMSSDSKKINTFIESIENSLTNKGCVKVEHKKCIFGNRTYFIPEVNEIDKVIQKIRAELLEEGEVSEETIALVSLLDKSLMIKNYFSKYESNELKKRLKEIRQSSSSQLIKQMIDSVDAVVAAFTALAVVMSV